MAKDSSAPGKLAILVGGGPAPGINAVIAGAAREGLRNGLEVIGCLDGFKWLIAGDTGHTIPLTYEVVDRARLRGGSILRTSRENPTNNVTKLDSVIATLRNLGVTHLVTIGGDDTAFSASETARHAGAALRVAHVPKTIDNDLPLPGNMPTFGYNTAREVGGELVRNLMEDARTATRWYIVVAMGRSAGHLALGIGVLSGSSLTIIPEEFGAEKPTLDGVCSAIEGSVLKSRAMGRDYGVAVVAEGVAEKMVDELKDLPMVEVKRDKHGHVRLAEVPFGLILKKELQKRAEARGDKEATFVDVTIGYELRCADPIAFDVEYGQHLGWGASRYLLRLGEEGWGETGALISVQSGEIVPIPFQDILDPQTGRTTVRRVNMSSDVYRSARSGMVRLEREDLESDSRLAPIAAAAGLPPDEMRARFGGTLGR
ncbi:MAG TPA: 6-phosphofructokinase [Chthonomonadales bacterium]|nr:6-phosphofructokinase [Chthonomonadales bacterium]